MKTRKKRSVIWKISKDELIILVNKYDSLRKILIHLNLPTEGGTYQVLKNRLDNDKIDYSHIPNGLKANLGRNFLREKMDLKDILVVNSKYQRGHLKTRLLKEKIIENKCSICGIGSMWNNKPIIMILDHINGINNDHRIENLRMVCPNCNSQLETFSGRNTKQAKMNKMVAIA